MNKTVKENEGFIQLIIIILFIIIVMLWIGFDPKKIFELGKPVLEIIWKIFTLIFGALIDFAVVLVKILKQAIDSVDWILEKIKP